MDSKLPLLLGFRFRPISNLSDQCPLIAPATWMEILTEETFFILTQPRCFSAWDIFFLAVVSTVEEEAGSSEKLLGSTLILGNPWQ